jgi:hypothetical protein
MYIQRLFKEGRLTSLQEVKLARPMVIQKRRVRPSHRTLGQKSGYTDDDVEYGCSGLLGWGAKRSDCDIVSLR